MRIAVELVRLLSKQDVTVLTPANIFIHLTIKGIPEDRANLSANYLGGDSIVQLAAKHNLKPSCVRKRLMTTLEKMKNF